DQCQNLLSEAELARFWDEHKVCMWLPLDPLYVQSLYKKFHLLKTLVLKHRDITPLAILKRLEPYVGSSYEKVKHLPSLKARFQAVTNIYKPSSANGARISIANSQRLMEIMNISDAGLMANPVEFKEGPFSALDQLQALQKEQVKNKERLKDSLTGPIEASHKLDEDGERHLINKWFESKEAYDRMMLHDSEQIGYKHLNSFNFQNKGPLLSYLDLRGAKELREASFMALHNYCLNLEYLNISEWPLERLGNFTQAGILGSLVLQEGPIFPQLKRLIAKDCVNLVKIQLELPSIISLEASGNKKLREFSLSAPHLKLLDLEGHQIEQSNFYLAANTSTNLQIKGVSIRGKEILQALQNHIAKKLDLSGKK
ncbi:MAG: hypothetical protein ACK4M7_10270, partial [Burkholderiales bacterium]